MARKNWRHETTYGYSRHIGTFVDGTGLTLAEILRPGGKQTYTQSCCMAEFDPMYGPAVRRKGNRDGEVGLALMYPALCGAVLLAIMDIRAHPFS
jgi:hypothetical protein